MIYKFKKFLEILSWQEKKGRTRVKYGETMKLIEDDEKLYRFIKKNCKEWINEPKPIFRLIDSTELTPFYQKPIKRFSRDNKNYYTLIMDNDPDWIKYPSRSKSFICSLNYQTDQLGGGENLYNIIPIDGSVWGVLPKNDIYSAFGKALKKIGVVGTIGSLLGDMNRFFKKQNRTWDNKLKGETFLLKKIPDTSFDRMKDAFNYNQKLIDDNGEDFFRISQNTYDNKFLFFLTKSIGKNHFEEFLKIIKPHNIKSQTYDELKPVKKPTQESSKEIWTESTCLFLTERKYKEIKKHFNK